jgi:O-antigen/teichoic acid export membrane protein
MLIVSMAVPAVVNLILNLLLIPRFGLDGALWATTASYAVGAVAAWMLGQSAQPLPVPWSTLAKAGGACALMAGAVLALPSPGGLFELILKAGAGALVYGAVVLALDIDGLRARIATLVARRKVRPA